MYKTRFLNIGIGSTLILAALAAFLAFKPWSGAKPDNQQYSGMGDLRRFEARSSYQVNLSVTGGGDGDQHRSEAAQILPVTGSHESSRGQTGMGDLHLSEARQLTNGHRNVGMGDLHLLDSR